MSFAPFPSGKHFWAESEKHLVTMLSFHVKFVKLFTTWESSTLCKCYLKESTVLSGGALGSQHVALHFGNIIERPSHTERPFPAHTRKADKQTLNNYSSAVWAVFEVLVEIYFPHICLFCVEVFTDLYWIRSSSSNTTHLKLFLHVLS